ncbi:hypothetical protein GCM10018980_40290 [Streptomyces capoamus]|uniref:Uncharacterized protein n=1 Tax=Streptomyces capoamus TaxID=68183 RepID=A0A919C6B0_9ACTN|nr:hypothetical protein GCM10010501_25900 [Streptomyces libani subsp. rufus]GHG55085.1 hypothetical protein GCM10018980_40290 [Streptomyces capoamus]
MPDAVLAHEDADRQVDEQAGEPAAGGDPDGRDGDQQDDGADEQELVEVVDGQRVPPPGKGAGDLRLLRYLT